MFSRAQNYVRVCFHVSGNSFRVVISPKQKMCGCVFSLLQTIWESVFYFSRKFGLVGFYLSKIFGRVGFSLVQKIWASCVYFSENLGVWVFTCPENFGDCCFLLSKKSGRVVFSLVQKIWTGGNKRPQKICASVHTATNRPQPSDL